MSSITFKTYYILADCNNFYVSCERLFNPGIQEKPVIVLSNNDGCVIARSEEAKRIGIKMGEPFFKIKNLCATMHIEVFSSNYQLYGDISQRIMHILSHEAPEIEIYSIDEAFMRYNSISGDDLSEECVRIRKKMKKWIGMPLSFGIAPTKTLAKIANNFAKKHRTLGVFNLTCPDLQNTVLKEYPIEAVWGIGRGFTNQLKVMGIYSAWDFKEKDPVFIRKRMGVIGERILWELRGISCLPISLPQPKQSITSSRSFGQAVTSQEELIEAIATFVSKAAVRLRAQNSYASAIYVYLEAFVDIENGLKRKFGALQKFPLPTNSTPQMISTAKEILFRIYTKNQKYKKCGIILLDIIDEQNFMPDLLLGNLNQKSSDLMHTIDEINAAYGKDKIFFGAMGTNQKWKARKELCSGHNTTSWLDLPIVKC